MAPRIPLARERLRRRRTHSAPVAAPARAAHERPHGDRSRAGQHARAAAVPAQRAAPLVHAHGGHHPGLDGRLVGRAAALRDHLRASRGANGCSSPGRPWPASAWRCSRSRTAFRRALLCVLISSLGVAGFHPEASKFAAWLSGERRSTAMSVFSVGGNLGVAIGPLLAGLIAAQYGLGGRLAARHPGPRDRGRRSWPAWPR